MEILYSVLATLLAYLIGSLSFAVIVISALGILYSIERKWVNNWVGEGGKVLPPEEGRVIMAPALAMEIW